MSKTINQRQLRALYWPTWNKAKKVLITDGGHTAAEAEELRKEIHIQVTGADCSSKALSNRQLDEVLRRFNAIGQPANGAEQARLADQPRQRVLHQIRAHQERMDLSEPYLNAIALHIGKRPLADCSEAALKDVLKALRYHENRHPQQPG